MSFNINFNQPAIQSAQGSQDGGAGNLGYMKAGEKGNSKHKEETNSIFEEQRDSFVREGQEPETFDLKIYFEKMFLMIKLMFLKIVQFFTRQ